MVHFYLKYSVQNLIIPEKELCYDLKMTHSVKIRLEKPDKKYADASLRNDISFCTAEIALIPNEKNIAVFNKIINNKSVENDDEYEQYSKFTDSKGNKITIPQLSFFPEHFIDFVNQIHTELSDATKQTTNVLRWVCGIKGVHNPFASLGFQFSLDGENKYPMPSAVFVEVEQLSYNLKLNESRENAVNDLLKKQVIEPIHHSLFREAWGLRSANPRSSLIIAISSIEIGLKYLIETNIPDSKWLIENIQSPPIVKIFKELIPILPIENKINENKILLPSTIMLDNLEKWVNLRNTMIHKGKGQLRGNKLKKMLMSVNDMLYIIDYNSGYSWALTFIRKETLDEIGVKIITD